MAGRGCIVEAGLCQEGSQCLLHTCPTATKQGVTEPCNHENFLTITIHQETRIVHLSIVDVHEDDTCLHPQISTQANFCTGCGTTVLILLSPQISVLFTS